MSRPSQLFISSADFININDTYDNFTVELPNSVQGAKRMEVLNVSVPMTCPNIPSYEQHLYIQMRDCPPVSGILNDNVVRITIDTTKSYDNITDFITELQSKTAVAVNLSRSNMSVNPDITWGYDSNRKKITFAVSNFAKLRFCGYLSSDPLIASVVNPNNLYNNLSYRMGFVNRFDVGYWETSQMLDAATPTAHTNFVLARTTNIYVLADLAQGSGVSSKKRTGGLTSVIAKVPSPNSFTGNIVHFEKNLLDDPIVGLPAQFKTISFRLLDDEAQPLQLASDGPGSVHITLRVWYD